MQEQLLPFEQAAPSDLKPRRRYKNAAQGRRVVEASVDAYEKIRNGRSKLYKPILKLLAECPSSMPADCLTAREILRALQRQGLLPAGAERNNVSPRLTELLEAGCVEQPAYSKKLPGQAAAGVWRITEKGRAML